MKLPLFILALTLCQIYAQIPGGYNPIEPSELNQDQNIQDILSFGARYVVERGIQEKKLQDANYEVSAIYSASRQVVNGLNYQFDVEIQNNIGTIIRASYIVYDQARTNTRQVSSYSYQIEQTGTNGELDNLEFLPDDIYWSEEESLPTDDEQENPPGPLVGGYSQMDLEEAQNDPEVQNLLNFGVQYITGQQVSAQNIPEDTYTVSQLHSVWTQVVSGTNYRFDADITNELGWVLRATFVVYSQPWTNTQEVSSYVYAVTTNPNPSEEEEFVLPNEEDLDGAYEPIDSSELKTNSILKGALDAGVSDVVGQAVSDHRLPDSTYEVTQVHSIYGQVVSGMNYRFDVDLTNCAGLVARAVFTVYSQPWTSTLETTLEALDVTSIPEEGLIGGECPNGDDNNEESNLGEEEEPILVGGYTPIDPEEAMNDPIIQELLNYGAQYVANRGIEDHRLPSGRYAVSHVNSVAEQVVEGKNYKFDVELANCEGLTVRATYVVNYIPWLDSSKVISYKYDITAAPNGLPMTGGCPNEGGEEEWIPTEEEEPIVGGWSPVDLEEAENDKDIQDALNLGIEEFNKQAVADGKIPEDLYKLGELNSVEEQVVSGIKYRFDVDLQGDEGNTVKAILVVYSESWTNTLELSSYTIIAVGPADEESSENNEEEEPLAGGWSSVDLGNAQNDKQLQDALNFGVEEFAKKAIGDGEIPDAEYQVGELNSAEQQVVNGMKYKFDVNVLSNTGTTTRVILEVYSQPSTNTLELNSYNIMYVGPAEENPQ